METLSKFFRVDNVIAPNGQQVRCFVVDKGKISVDKILKYARARVNDVDNLALLKKELSKLIEWKNLKKKDFYLDPENLIRIETLKRKIDNIRKSINNKAGLEKIGLMDDVVGNKKLLDFVMIFINENARKIEERDKYICKLSGPKGNTTVLFAFKKLPNGEIYLNTIHIY